MLSNAEQRSLTEIERGLRLTDPEFVDRLAQVMPSRPPKWRGMSARAWLLTAVLIMGVAALMTSLGVALLAVSVAGVSAAIWLTNRGCSTNGRRSSP